MHMIQSIIDFLRVFVHFIDDSKSKTLSFPLIRTAKVAIACKCSVWEYN